jgi:2-polyprenyl-3-methyl-5-hydroxy-6-metoxy-1,4-benzoquinol methylase
MTDMHSENHQEHNFSQVELDKFNALANRWWGEAACLRAIGSRAAERTRMDARAGEVRQGWFGAYR